MKKKLLLIIAVIVVVVIAIILAARYFPKPGGDDAAGTIGKAEKFRKGQFTADDILLRDDILKDTTAVGKTLDQVVAFGSFMQQEKLIIDTLWIREIIKNCPDYPGCAGCTKCQEAIRVLSEYSLYLENGRETVKKTCNVLLDAYNGRKQDLSGDVGFVLLSFVQLVDEMVQRDSVLTSAIRLVDEFLNSRDKITDKKRQEALNRMKEVRDHMVIDNLLFAAKTGDKKQGEVVASIPMVCSGQQLSNVIWGAGSLSSSNAPVAGAVAGPISAIIGSYGLQLVESSALGVYSGGRYESIISGSLWVAANESDNLVRNMGLYASTLGIKDIASSPALQGGPEMQNIVSAGLFLSQDLGVVINNQTLNLCSAELGTIFNSSALGLILSTEQ